MLFSLSPPGERPVRDGLVLIPPFSSVHSLSCVLHRERSQFLIFGAKKRRAIFGSLLMSAGTGILFQLSINTYFSSVVEPEFVIMAPATGGNLITSLPAPGSGSATLEKIFEYLMESTQAKSSLKTLQGEDLHRSSS
jgi:hypothetical protein